MANNTAKVIISADTAKAESSMRSLGQSLDNVSHKMFDMSGTAKSLAGTLTVAAFAAYIKGAIDTADALNDLAKRTGASVETLGGLRLAAELSGTSLEAIAKGTTKLSVSLTENGDTFKKFGITTTNQTEALIQLGDVFAGMEDPVQRTALAVKIFGKAGDELIPLLMEGSDGMRRMIERGNELSGITEGLAVNSEKLNDSLAEMKVMSGALGNSLANELVGPLNDVILAMIQAKKESGTLAALWAGMGGLGTFIFTDDMLSRADQLKKQIAEIDSRLNSSGLFSKLRGDAANDNLRAQRIVLQMQLDALNAQGEFDEKLAKFKRTEGGSKTGANMLNALGGNGTDKNKKPFTPEENYAWEVELAREKNRKKAEEEFAKTVEESNRMIFDIDPIAKATDAWEKLVGLKQQGLLTDEQIGKIYAKNFGQADAKAVEEAQRIILDIDPVARATAEWEKLTALKERGLLTDEQMVKAYAKTFGENMDQMGIYAKRFADNVQRNLGDVLYNGLNGKFTDIGDAFKQMLMRMAADAAAAQLTEKMFGNMATTGNVGGWAGDLMSMFSGSSWASTGAELITQEALSASLGVPFEGGGFTGYGSRSGGVDGKGGFRAILHPNETVIDHVKGGRAGATIHYAPVINIDSRTDRAEIQRLVSGAVKQGNAELVDKLQRAGALA